MIEVRCGRRLGTAPATLALGVAVVLALGGPAVLAPVALAAPSRVSAGGPDAGPTELVTVRDPRISESSALAASPTHPDLVWTVNDSGHTASVFGVSTTTGRTRVVLRLAGTDARDWESMATQQTPAGAVIWVGDTGDNRAVRESVVLRLVREPARLPTVEGATVRVTPVSLRVRYPDGPHDVETLVVTPDGRLLLVSKGIFSGGVYQVPPAAVAAALAGRSTLAPVTAVVVGPVRQSLVTDGAALPDGRIVLRGYYDAVVYEDQTAKSAGLRPLKHVALPDQEQGEGLAVVEGGRALLVSSEGLSQPLWRVPLTGVDGPRDVDAGTTPPSPGAPSPSAAGAGGSWWPWLTGGRLVGGTVVVGVLALVGAVARRRG